MKQIKLLKPITAMVLVVSLASIAFLSDTVSAADQRQQRGSTNAQDPSATVVFPNTLNAEIADHQETELQVIVPSGAVEGDIFVQTVVGTSNDAPFQLSIPEDPPVDLGWQTAVSGTITTSTIWDENVLVTGDIEIQSGVTLTITPGVRVYFAAGQVPIQ